MKWLEAAARVAGLQEGVRKEPQLMGVQRERERERKRSDSLQWRIDPARARDVGAKKVLGKDTRAHGEVEDPLDWKCEPFPCVRSHARCGEGAGGESEASRS